MHFVRFGICNRDRQERASADVKGHRLAFDTAFGKTPNKLRREMKSCRWRSNRALLSRKDRLIVGAITLVHGSLAAYVGRQGDFTLLRNFPVELGPG